MRARYSEKRRMIVIDYISLSEAWILREELCDKKSKLYRCIDMAIKQGIKYAMDRRVLEQRRVPKVQRKNRGRKK